MPYTFILALAIASLTLSMVGQSAAEEPLQTTGSVNTDGAAIRSPEADRAMAELALELAQCQAKGGELRVVDTIGKPACVIPYPDAGKVCSDSSQCTGTCRITGDESRAKQIKPGAVSVKGTCQKDKFDLGGCYAKLSKGMMGVIVCMD